MHVPIHNENEIHVYKSWINPFLQLYKNSDDAFEAKEQLEELTKEFQGVFLSPPINHPRDERNLETLLNIVPNNEGFLVFAPPLQKNDNVNPNVVVVLSHHDDTLADRLNEYKQHTVPTCITLKNDESGGGSEPFELANQIADVMDESGGGNFVSVSSLLSQDEDYVVQLCEELSYLDVPGPTMKSRLILDSSEADAANEDLVDEVMMMGVNKFVVSDEQQHECIQSVANEQGKQLVTVSSN